MNISLICQSHRGPQNTPGPMDKKDEEKMQKDSQQLIPWAFYFNPPYSFKLQVISPCLHSNLSLTTLNCTFVNAISAPLQTINFLKAMVALYLT